MRYLVLLTTLYIFIHKTTSENVIYHLEPVDYHRMPVKYHVDRFGRCVNVPGGAYCTTQAALVSDEPSSLMDMIQGFSRHSTKHYNHSQIKYGLCLTSTCKQFYDGDNSEAALRNTTEACLNDTLYREYGLKSRVKEVQCLYHGQKFSTDALEVAVGLVLAIILALNLAGTIYDIWIRGENQPGNFLIMFSIRDNRKRMTVPKTLGADPNTHFKFFDPLRSYISFGVIIAHVAIGTLNYTVNTEYQDGTHLSSIHYMGYHAHLFLSTFFVMSGFLLSYRMVKLAEKKTITWRDLLKSIRNRWLRLSPTMLVVLMISIILHRIADFGPFWPTVIGEEVYHCRKYGLYNILFLSNLVDKSRCNLHAWSAATDMQLYIIGSAVVALSPSRRARHCAMAVLFLIGICWPAYLIYINDWDGTYLPLLSVYDNMLSDNGPFNYVYKRTAPNLPAFIVGMALGEVVHHFKKNKLCDRFDTLKYRIAYWASIPLACLSVAVGCVFFQDGPRVSLFVRVIFRPIVVTVFSVSVAVMILRKICKEEKDSNRGVQQSTGWEQPSRISYCMFISHLLVIFYSRGTNGALFYGSNFHTIYESVSLFYVSYFVATYLHLMVEAPFARIVDKLKSAKPAKPASSAEQLSMNTMKNRLKSD